MGAVPAWYRVIKAAQYLRVDPWTLAEKPLAWIERAEEAQAAEAAAAEQHEKTRQAQQGLRG